MANNKQQIGMGLHLTKNPAGTWSFVGTVPVVLGYVTKDGSTPTDKQLDDARSFGPGIVGLKTRVWANPVDAANEAKKLGVALCSCAACWQEGK